MKTTIPFYLAALILSACGGGGASGTGATSPPVIEAPGVNAVEAFKNIIGRDKITNNIPAVSPVTGTATLIVRTEESYPFYTNGTPQQTASSKVFQFQRIAASGTLTYQSIWKLHLDAQMRPIGVASGNEFGSYKECTSITSRNDLPGATNSSGIFFSGVQTSNYAETFRAGIYAHYCDPSLSDTKNTEWSVLPGSPSPYFCLTMPAGSYAVKTRICHQVSTAGALANSIWIAMFDSTNTIFAEYKN
jgi:hypothetical protein